ncbi:MAG: hypothetical protein WBX27_21125, partial [Specibacter sp.]
RVSMRMVRKAKAVSLVVGGGLTAAGCLGLGLAALLAGREEDGRNVWFALLPAVVALIIGLNILTYDRRSKPSVLMRMQMADVLPGLLPVTVFASIMLSMPRLADPARPYLWVALLLVGSLAISVVPAERAVRPEIPKLRPGQYLDWLRRQNFGAGTLLFSIAVTAMYFTNPGRVSALTPLVVVLATAQAAVSVWRIIEHLTFAKSGVRLSGLQISWLRAIHVQQGHEAAVLELRTMCPKIGPADADSVIENLHRA